MLPGRTRRRGLAVALAAATVALLLLPAASPASSHSPRAPPVLPTGEGASHAAVAAPSPSFRPAAAAGPGADPGGGAPISVESTIFPEYNASLPGNFASSTDSWTLGTPAFVPPSSLWYPELPNRSSRGPSAGPAPVVVYNTTTGGFAGFVPSLGNLSALVYDPANGYVYGTDPFNDSVVVFDAQRMVPVAGAIPVGSRPTGLALDVAVGSLFVSNSGSDNVTVIDTDTGRTVVPGVSVGTNPGPLVADPADDVVFVANLNGSNLTVLNASDPTQPTHSVGLVVSANSLAYSPALGLLAVTQPATLRLDLVSASKEAVLPTYTVVGLGAHSLVTAPNGSYFVMANQSGDLLESVNASNASTTNPVVAATIALPVPATSLTAVPGYDQLVAWSQEYRSLSRVNLSSNSVLSPPARLNSSPGMVAFDDATDSAWVADGNASVLSGYAYANASNVTLWSDSGSPVESLADFAEGGAMFVGQNGSVSRFAEKPGALRTGVATVSGSNTALLPDPLDGLLWDENSQLGTIALNLSSLRVQFRNLSVPAFVGSSATFAAVPALQELFVVDSHTGGVYVLDSANGALIDGPIAAGANATDAVYDPLDGCVYVAGAGLTAIDVTTLDVGPAIPTSPHSSVAGIGFDPTRGAIDLVLSGPAVGAPGVLDAIDGSSLAASETGFFSTPVGVGPSDLEVVVPTNADMPGSAFVLVANSGAGTVSVLATPPTIRSIALDPIAPDVNETLRVQVTAAGGAGPSAIEYGLPPGCSASNVLNFSCTPSEPGTFGLEVTITDPLGFVATSSTNVTVTSAFATQVRVVTPSDGVADIGETLGFLLEANHQLASIDVNWSFGDGSSASGLNATHAYSALGDYAVTATATDAAGVTDVSSVVVDIVPAPVVVLSVTGSNVTDVGVPRSFDASVVGGLPGNGNWSFGDGNGSSDAATEHRWSAPGNYSVTYRYVDGWGLTANATLDVRVNSKLEANVSVTVGDVGAPLQFSATPLGGTPPYVVVWGFGDGSNATALDVHHTYGQAGDYNVTASIYDAAGGSVNTSFSVPVNPAPAPSSGSTNGNWVPPLTLGLILGGAIGAIVLFVAEPGRRRPPQRAPSPYVPPAHAQSPVWKE